MKEISGPFSIYTIDSGIDGPHLLITAGVHGDEYEPMLVAQELISQLKDKLKTGKLTIVPVVNISAYKGASRYGNDGLDLARTCPGNADGMATEIVAYHITELIKKADYYIDMHTGGEVYDIFPLAGYLLHPLPHILEKQREMAEKFNLPLIWGTEHTPNGRTLSIARDANVAAIYVEYGGGSSVSKEIVKAYIRGCLRVLQYLKMIAVIDQVQSHIPFWLEDHTINNGNLQMKMPAPCSGIFVSEATIGELISKGDIIGNIIDPLNHQLVQIKAEHDGLVFLLRVSANVKTGDSLGGILPVTKNKKVIING